MTARVRLAGAASEHCQRWDHGRHSWRHPSDGGFDQERYTVELIPEAAARGFVATHHCAGSSPAARFAFGLFDVEGPAGSHLVGVAVLSVPMSNKVLTNVFPELDPTAESLELGRFILTDTPANAESWFIAQVWRAAAERGIRGIVSFADPMPRSRTILDVDGTGSSITRVEQLTPGHVGLIYQATTGLALGRSTPRTLIYVPAHGIVLSERSLSKIRTGEPGADAAEARIVSLGARPRRAGQPAREWLKQAVEDVSAQRVRHPGNFRYAWALGSARQRRAVRITGTPTVYPKPRTHVLAATA